MKKLLSFFAFLSIFFGTACLQGQLAYKGYVEGYPTLENRWMDDSKISMLDETATIDRRIYEIGIYNADLSLYKNFSIRSFFPRASNGFGWLYDNDRKEFFVTQTFFNDDELLEFIVSDPGTLSTKGFFAIVNENGEKLYEAEGKFDGKFFLYQLGEKKYLFARAVYTDVDLFLVYEVMDEEEPAPSESKPLLRQVGVYPNPAEDHVNISYQVARTNPVTMKILNANGQTVATILLDNEQEQYRLDISGYSPGTYIYTYEDKSGKFIVK